MAADELVALNVSGQEYRVLRSVLTAVPGPLAVMAGGAIPSATDGSGRPHVDCDPELFRYVVNYLRRRRAFLPTDFSRWDELRAEFDFLSLPFPDDASALQQKQEAAVDGAKRRRELGPLLVSLSVVNYGGADNCDQRTNWVRMKQQDVSYEDGDSSINLVVDPPVRWHGDTLDAIKVVPGTVMEVVAINEKGNFCLRREHQQSLSVVTAFSVSGPWAKLGSWLESVDSSEIPVSKTSQGWWRIDGKETPTPGAAICYLTAHGFRQVGSVANGTAAVLTFARDR